MRDRKADRSRAPRARGLLVLGIGLVVAALPAACANPVKSTPSKEAQLAMLKDPGYYAEQQHDGRWYVFGDEKSHQGFAKTHEMKLSRTLVGEGPGGATVVFEVQDKLPELTDRIMGTFSQRHGVSMK